MPSRPSSKKTIAHKPSSNTRKVSNPLPFPVVGMGASAGGLDAFKQFFSAMPADSGMAFVLVQHLAPEQESLTADILAKHTAMTVAQVEDKIAIEPNHVYVIPPNTNLSIRSGVLYLSAPVQPHGHRLPIDFFFRSLAEDQEAKALCIILSGTGRDGTLGLKAIKGHGGMAIAQSPETAQFDGMPRSAIDTGLIDYVLPVAEMPAVLIDYLQHAQGLIRAAIVMSMSAAQAKRNAINPWTSRNSSCSVFIGISCHKTPGGAENACECRYLQARVIFCSGR